MAVSQVSSSDLVPGDLIELEEGVQVPCDALLIEGGAVINESMLTGRNMLAGVTVLAAGVTVLGLATNLPATSWPAHFAHLARRVSTHYQDTDCGGGRDHGLQHQRAQGPHRL